MHLIEQMGLSRTHRRLFLLIDGGRTVKELIRLMSHDPEDVQKLLQDLERAGAIQT
jgi:DNA-binding MarR family transcriptional regulator